MTQSVTRFAVTVESPRPVDLESLRSSYGPLYRALEALGWTSVAVHDADVETLLAENAQLRRRCAALEEGARRLLAEVDGEENESEDGVRS